MINSSVVRSRANVVFLLLILSLGLSLKAANARVEIGHNLQDSQPAFSKAFAPDTVGPGSTSTLTFTINNPEPTPVDSLAFTDTLPAGVTIATPSSAVSTCSEGLLTAPDGGTTITLSGARLGVNSSCTVVVNVTAPTAPGTYTNTSGDLTSSAGNSGSATADLTVDATLPGFSKSFSPSTIFQDDNSTLTFTIDNSVGPSDRFNLSFGDDLPSGVVVASPANVTNGCNGTLIAEPATTSISLFSGFVAASSVCTVTVNVTGTTPGAKNNVSDALNSSAGNSGFATALLEVEPLPPFHKTFTDDPVPPGGTATLDFSITNMDRFASAIGINFTDDLDATLSGLTAVPPLPVEPCGAGSTLSGTSLLTMSGGSLVPSETCTFSVTVQVPAGAALGTFPNTTSTLESDAGTMADPATDDLVVSPIPTLSMSFLPNPVGAGETVDLEFTIDNNSDTSQATDITFSQALGDVLPGVSVLSLPAPGFCGPGSTMDQTTPAGVLTLNVSGASLASGSSCTFQVTLQLPASTPNGTYTLTSSAPQATVDGETLFGHPASEDLTVIAAPSLSKSFSDDPVLAGDTVTLEFTLIHSENAPAEATGITFTDDLEAALTGLTAIGLPANDVCGAGSSLSGTSSLTFTGGTLSPNDSCTFSVTLQVPADAASGDYTNTTSDVSATVDGHALTGAAASDDLQVAGLILAKSFSADTVVQGETVTLDFTLSNVTVTSSATDISFSDNLDDALSGLTAVSPLPVEPCGAGSQLSGTSTLTLSGGRLGPGVSCTFSVTLQVPASATPGEHQNTTSPATATVGGESVVVDAATDTLTVLDALSLTKSFTDDPVPPGGTVTLAFTVTNRSSGNGITGITFSDDLDAALSGLAAVAPLPSDPCGAGSQLSGTSNLTLTGGSLGPATSCAFDVTLQVPAGAPLGTVVLNTTSSATGTLDGTAITASPASDELQINHVAFTKSFDGPTVAGGNQTLNFTIENLDTSQGQSNMAFSDDLDAVIPGLTAVGLPADDVCGVGSTLSGTSFLTFTGGNLNPGASCTFDVTLQVPASAAPGSYPNTTSDLFVFGLAASVPAEDSLTIEPPPLFAKSFAPNPIALGGISTLTFTIDNTASTLAASGLAFTDNLPAGVTVAAPSNASTTCSGGTVTATPGSGVISYSEGSVAAGASCTVQVDVAGNATGTHLNTTGDLTSSSGNSGTASDTLTVTSPELVVAVTALPDSVPEPSGSVTMTVVVTNESTIESVTLETLVDDVHGNLAGQGSCDVPTALGVGESYTCDFSATVTGNAGESITNTVTATVVDADDNEATAQDSATVTVTDVLPDLSAGVTATPTVIYEPAGPVTFTVRVTNTSGAEPVSLTMLADDVAGDLDGQGTCSLPQSLAAGDSYQCRYLAQVSGQAGDPVTNTATATVEDDEANQASAQAEVTIAVYQVLYYPFIRQE